MLALIDKNLSSQATVAPVDGFGPVVAGPVAVEVKRRSKSQSEKLDTSISTGHLNCREATMLPTPGPLSAALTLKTSSKK